MSNEQDVQEKRLNAMKYKILKTEQENLKTREKTTDQMVETIRRIIMDEAKKRTSVSFEEPQKWIFPVIPIRMSPSSSVIIRSVKPHFFRRSTGAFMAR